MEEREGHSNYSSLPVHKWPAAHLFAYVCYFTIILLFVWTAVSRWLRCCATNRKVAGSIPGGVIGIFH